MGKGRIISEQGEGLYTIELLEDRNRAEADRTTAVQRIAYLDDRLASLQVELSGAQIAVDNAAIAQDQAITAYRVALSDPEIDTAEAKQDMVEAGTALTQAVANRDALAGNIRALKVERLALQRRIDRIDALPALRQQQAWCADYTPELSGEVATAEVPGEVGQVLVRPGFDGAETNDWPVVIQGGASWSASRDGALQPALSGTPASVYYSLAMLPGWQRWRPTFRLATISNIDNDLCDITLEPATSSQQGLDVNAQGSYSGVPIYYMECNGAAFTDGDKVLVAFSGNTEAPMVVGFESNPKRCKMIAAFPTQVRMEIQTASRTANDCMPPEPEGWYDRRVAEFDLALTQKAARLYMGADPDDFSGLSSIEQVTLDYKEIDGGAVTISERFIYPRRDAYFMVRFDDGPCVQTSFPSQLSRIPWDKDATTSPGQTLVVDNTTTQVTLEMQAQESQDYVYPFPGVGSVSYYLLSPVLVADVQYYSMTMGLADFPEISGMEAAEIIGVLDGQEDVQMTTIINAISRNKEYVLVRYE